MSSAKFTLIGCYQFFHNAGDDLFKNLTLPTGINKDILTSNILTQGAEFEVQNADPFYIQSSIGVWSGVWQDTMQRWVDALAIEYAPLENYDRMEHWTDETDVEGTGSSTSTGTLDSTTTTNMTTENTRSAFDSSTYQPNDKSVTSGTEVNDTDTTDRSNTTLTNDTDSEHNGRVHGNIGVTTSQQMLQQELDMGYWNLYERITELFLREFCIPVYV